MELFNQLHPHWQQLLSDKREILDAIERRIDKNNVTPDFENILAAYHLPPQDIKVVIFGQDPYPTPGNANGLAFSVSKHVQKLPASLRNIFKELHDDCGTALPIDGDLHRWSEQGVFLLNRTLSTVPGMTLGHSDIGWNIFTQATAQILGQRQIVGVFWGTKAYELAEFFSPELIISSAHPSPLSAYRGFFGSKVFSKVNTILESQGKASINW